MNSKYTISSVTVKDFALTNSSFTIKFDSNTNFIIGENGLGKTTLINLIASILECDTETMSTVEFSEVEIKLASSQRNKPIIKVINNIDSYIYQIKHRASDNDYVLNTEIHNDVVYMHTADGRRIARRKPTRRVYNGRTSQTSEIKRVLNSYFDLSWLTIHRTSNQDRFEDNSYESTVDMKIKRISSDLLRYFSSLDSHVSKRLEHFQKNVFNLLIDSSTKLNEITKLDLDEEKESLKRIYLELNILNNDSEKLVNDTTNKKIEQHFNTVKKVKQKIFTPKDKQKDQDSELKERDIIALYRTIIAHDAIANWNEFEEFKINIYKQKNAFIQLLNSLFNNKEAILNDDNELVIVVNNKTIGLNKLSSGEKQLLIILGEALLQNNNPWVYIADEPELSLHVVWQESLVRNILTLNPNAQLIFATHSPDIVSSYSKNIINIKEVI